LERDLAALQNDVRQGYVSKDAAERLYGAVFLAGSLRIDHAATVTRRTAMRARGEPVDEPVTPSLPGAVEHNDHNHPHGHLHDNLTEEERLVIAMTGRCCS
jgi:N-methylhydantoinase B